MPSLGPRELNALRKRAEHALEVDSLEAAGLLEELEAQSADGSDAALFAQRNLATLYLEESPWKALLHLRKVVVAAPRDPAVHALMGLCQALLGNYRAAVNAYRKAAGLDPEVPSYQHNLGHLLDVALGECEAAEAPLAEALRLSPEDDQIIASYAACLARLAHRDGEVVDAQRRANAERFARTAVALAPEENGHRELLAWIEEGAPMADVQAEEAALADAVVKLLEDVMPAHDYSPRQVNLAKALWDDFVAVRHLTARKAGVYAAAVDHIIGQRHGFPVTKAKTARRYEVSPRSLRQRSDEIHEALGLRDGDRRYC